MKTFSIAVQFSTLAHNHVTNLGELSGEGRDERLSTPCPSLFTQPHFDLFGLSTNLFRVQIKEEEQEEEQEEQEEQEEEQEEQQEEQEQEQQEEQQEQEQEQQEQEEQGQEDDEIERWCSIDQNEHHF